MPTKERLKKRNDFVKEHFDFICNRVFSPLNGQIKNFIDTKARIELNYKTGNSSDSIWISLKRCALKIFNEGKEN